MTTEELFKLRADNDDQMFIAQLLLKIDELEKKVSELQEMLGIIEE